MTKCQRIHENVPNLIHDNNIIVILASFPGENSVSQISDQKKNTVYIIHIIGSWIPHVLNTIIRSSDAKLHCQGALKGCLFFSEMGPYLGSKTQKSVEALLG